MKGIAKANIRKIEGTTGKEQTDAVALEVPLEIRLAFEKVGVRHQKSISVTMRTPGSDEELALGFLFTEGILFSLSQIKNISRAATRWPEAKENVIVVELSDHQEVNFKRLERHFYTTSSCGVCGKASIEAIRVQGRFEIPENTPQVSATLLHTLPEHLLRHQSIFDSTGGLHAAALFDRQGRLLVAREDIGRHNALDTLIGTAWQKSMLPLNEHIILVSGRGGFELVQKSVVAGAPLLASVGAPSSLAVGLAAEAGMTLIGFLRNGQFNIYTHPERVILERH